MVTKLINKNTGQEINAESVFAETDSGVIVTNANCWKFVPNKQLDSQKELVDGEDYYVEAIPEAQSATREQSFHNPTSDNAFTEKAIYRFGLKDLTFCNRKFNKSSAIISSDIDVSDASYITISVADEISYNSSVEYSILDGTMETPILPEDINRVDHEKVFFNLPTRFIIDSSSESPILYKNGIVTDKNYAELSFNDLESDEYVISYVPGGEIHQYVPKNNTIKLKIVIRNYGDNFSPAIINNVLINKYGGGLAWT